MFFQMIYAAFSWLPPPLYMLVWVAFVLFWLTILLQAIRVFYDLCEFLWAVFGGFIMKVVGIFV